MSSWWIFVEFQFLRLIGFDFDLSFITLALDWLCYSMFSVFYCYEVIITRNTCLKFSFVEF